jgi:hypothetical protein
MMGDNHVNRKTVSDILSIKQILVGKSLIIITDTSEYELPQTISLKLLINTGTALVFALTGQYLDKAVGQFSLVLKSRDTIAVEIGARNEYIKIRPNLIMHCNPPQSQFVE